ncbi:cytochrome D ubiquinol oxidase subunit II [Lysinibacillus alkalisoli]|uniref:Cytochrome D ubiquinol oxidase subunit II n=1 Tax=Lysinibacillus alkalisoli TaxID=1911548 RepID=A0A917LFN7_9BACI|nr:cytochrome d ubiquinol oxidase subunit II [Lysinibacillus alkalisoli]GGG19220.1 cytochrome D ubiquinol oxidase subunit II [Lysinibacillus alkalisoli]
MELSEFWFLLIGVLFVGFMFLEGFDFGVGMSTRFLARNKEEREIMIKTIGPVWDANEVWLITAGGAMFAAFPHWYASVFSGYYLPFVLLLLALIVRGVSFEFREKGESHAWHRTWDYALLIGSILPPFLVGVLFTSMLKGLPIDAEMNINASFFGDILNLYTIVGGLFFVALSYLHGLFFIGLKTVDDIRARALQQSKKMYVVTGILFIAFVLLTVMQTSATEGKLGFLIMPMFIVGAVLYAALFITMNKHREGLSFLLTGLLFVIVVSSFFVGLFPNVLISSTDVANNISVYNAASGDYSLKIMTYVALTMVPIVLAYTAWTYYIFRKRIKSSKEEVGY